MPKAPPTSVHLVAAPGRSIPLELSRQRFPAHDQDPVKVQLTRYVRRLMAQGELIERPAKANGGQSASKSKE